MRRATTRDRCTAHCHRWAELSSPRAPPPPCSGHEQVDAFTRCVGEICEERTAAQPARATAQVRAWSHRGAIRGRRPVVAVFSLRRGSAHTPFSRNITSRRSRLVISETRGQASASGSTSYMPYTRRRPLSLSRYGRARGRGRHLLVRVDAAGPPRPRSYKILQPVDGRRRTGGWWKRRGRGPSGDVIMDRTSASSAPSSSSITLFAV